MQRIQLVIYCAVLLLAYCQENNIPIMPTVWYYTSKFWYGISGYAGTRGLTAEKNYYDAMELTRG